MLQPERCDYEACGRGCQARELGWAPASWDRSRSEKREVWKVRTRSKVPGGIHSQCGLFDLISDHET